MLTAEQATDVGGEVRQLAVVVVNYCTADLAIRCIDALAAARAAFPSLRIVLVDGASPDGSAARMADVIAQRGYDGWVTLLPLAVNGGFAFANNRAFALLADSDTPPDAIALVNPDARVRPGALEALVACLAAHPRSGAVGASLIHEDGRTQASAFRFPNIANELSRGARTRIVDRLLRQTSIRLAPAGAAQVPWVTGAAVLFRTAALREVGGFDEGFFLYFEETDLMRRLRAGGWEIWHEPAALVVHEGGAATKIRDPETGRPAARPMPRYWYASRRRFFALAGGRAYAWAAGAAWLAGHALWRLRCLVVRREDDGPHDAGRDLLRHGWFASARDTTPAVYRLGERPPERPAWAVDAA